MQLRMLNQIQEQQSPEVYFIPPFIFPRIEEEQQSVSHISQSYDLPDYGLLAFLLKKL